MIALEELLRANGIASGHHPPAHEQFAARCEARALLWQADEFSLHDGVDELERWRLRLGIDADIAQAIMARAFAAVRDDLRGWRP